MLKKKGFTFEPILLHDVVLHLRCHLLWEGGQVGRLLPARQVQKFGRGSPGSSLVLDVGLDELCGGVRDGLVGGRVAARAGVAQAGAWEHLHLVELVREVHVTVDGGLRALLLALAVVAVVGDAVGCDGEGAGGGVSARHSSGTPRRLITALTWAAVRCHVAVTGAVAIVAAADAAVLVIGARVGPIVWQPQLAVRLTHTVEAGSAWRKDTQKEHERAEAGPAFEVATHLPLVSGGGKCIYASPAPFCFPLTEKK